MLDIENDALNQIFITPVQSAQEMKDWILTFLDIDLPMGHVDPDSDSSPVEAMYEAYAVYRDDLCHNYPGFIWLSSRDSGKTLCGSILNVMLMVHFKARIAHLAAVKKQSEKCVEYVNTALQKIKPFLEKNGREISNESKFFIQVKNEDHTLSFLDVVTANLAGGNSQHCPVASYDEIDTLSKQGVVGYKEAQMIPTRYQGRGPLILKFSTRKFAFGIFEKEIEKCKETGEVIRRWNIIDITEHCPESRHRPDLPKQVRYIHGRLPLRNISVADYESLDVDKKAEFKRIEAYGGCASCPLLPVCQMRLAHRPAADVSDAHSLYKTISFTINQFKKIDADLAEAQLLCWKPSRSGLIYARFDETPKTGNVITLQEAWQKFTGGMSAPKDFQLRTLTDQLLQKGIKFNSMGDWGYRHAFAVIVSVQVGGEWWLVDSISVPGLDPDQQVAASKIFKEKYKIGIWFMDPSQPGMMAMFKKNGMPCKKFVKDVQLGIACVKTQVVDALGVRRLKILDHPGNAWLINGFRKHHYKLDSEGEPTSEPDDDEYADIMDSARYGGQNLFAKKGAIVLPPNTEPPSMFNMNIERSRNYESWMLQQARALATEDIGSRNITNSTKTLFVSFGDDDD